jgi:DNA repair protein RecN (Recombination protein N)
MLKRIALQDFVIVHALDLDIGAGFSVLTGETGAGKSILIDALQLALGGRGGDAGLVREGAARAEIAAEFDLPATLAGWMQEAGFDTASGSLLLRRTIDAQGKSRAWINGGSATVGQLREAGEHLVEIHGQHAWQSLTRPAAVRALLDAQAGLDLAPLSAAWSIWRQALHALEQARAQRDTLNQERERLQWQVSELDRLSPGEHEWVELNAEHTRLAHAQALLEAARQALDAVSEADVSADTLAGRAADALEAVSGFDAALGPVAEVLRSAQVQLQDASHSLQAYLSRQEPDPQRLAQLDDRLSTWMQLARRHRRQPAELPSLLQGWREELRALDASADLDALERQAALGEQDWRAQALQVSRARKAAAPRLAAAVTQAMQQLGMEGGRFEVALTALQEPQSFGLEQVEFLVAGHAGVSPRPLAKVASGGELSRLALAIAATATAAAAATGAASATHATNATAATTAHQRPTQGAVPTLIFDEIDAGVGGAVGDSVGRLMKQLGANTQVLAVTHLAQVAACADGHYLVSKSSSQAGTATDVQPIAGEARVSEIARMLGGERLTGTSRAHAQALLGAAR